MFGDFKQVMIKEFKMKDICLIFYYLGIEIKKEEDEIFVIQEKFVREVLKKFKIENYAKVNAPIEYGVKMSNNNEGEKINSTTFKSLVGILRYLTYTHSNILFGVGLISRFMEIPIITHYKELK
jgi:hypothetical protein